MNYVYVLDQRGNPLMPTRRYGWVRRALKSGKAKAVCTLPFTIQLTYDPDTTEVQSITLGIDPGRTNIGMATADGTGRCLYSSQCETRNREIPKLMEKRRQHRQASRRGERLARKRLARRLETTMRNILERLLPGCEKPVMVKDIINTESRFNNRRHKEGWLTPTATQLLRTHLNLVEKVCRILSISGIALEANRFAFMELEAGGHLESGVDYQCGSLYGYQSIREALKDLQDGRCLLCGERAIEHDHHLVPRSKGGSNTLANIAGLCEKCHTLVHTDLAATEKLAALKAGQNKKYGALSVLNQIIPYLVEALSKKFNGNIRLVSGWETKQFRDEHQIDKDHDIDAYCIAVVGQEPKMIDVPKTHFEIRQFRRHDRARIKSQTERVYRLDGTKVATNRRKRMEQKTDSLEDWYQKMVEQHGHQQADRMRSRLQVQKSTRRYNNPDRLLPGTAFVYQGKTYTMTGQLTGGQYFRAAGCDKKNFPARNIQVVRHNQGLVYV